MAISAAPGAWSVGSSSIMKSGPSWPIDMMWPLTCGSMISRLLKRISRYQGKPMSQFTCPCCGHKTLDSFHDWDVCPICCWEDDMLADVDGKSPANRGMLLSVAQANFILLGACD